MIHDSIKATGALGIVLYDANYRVKQEIFIPNLVVTVGKNLIASRLVGTSSNVMSHMAVGTSNTNLVAANTTLASELARTALTSGTASGNVVTYSATFNTGVGTGALVEAGIFNASSAGTMLCRTTFAVINKEASDILTINWNVTIN